MQLCLAPCVPGAASAHVGAEWCSASLSLALVGAENYVTSCDLRIFVDQPHRAGHGKAFQPSSRSTARQATRRVMAADAARDRRGDRTRRTTPTPGTRA